LFLPLWLIFVSGSFDMSLLTFQYRPFTRVQKILIGLLLLGIALNGAVWFSVRHTRAKWTNVPPPPSVFAAPFAGVGDSQFASRFYGLVIQNFGLNGGMVTPIKDYDFPALGQWMMLEDALDHKSDFTPFLAAYIFGGSQDPSKLAPIISYLDVASGNGEGEKWRWQAQAAYLARFKLKDTAWALRLAQKLASFKNPDMAEWARQMPAFIMNQMGDKEASLAFLLTLLKTNGDKLPPQEVNATVDYICDQILTKADPRYKALCEDKKQGH